MEDAHVLCSCLWKETAQAQPFRRIPSYTRSLSALTPCNSQDGATRHSNGANGNGGEEGPATSSHSPPVLSKLTTATHDRPRRGISSTSSKKRRPAADIAQQADTDPHADSPPPPLSLHRLPLQGHKVPLFAVLDGHLGGRCSAAAASWLASHVTASPQWSRDPEAALRTAFASVEAALLRDGEARREESGTTAAAVMLCGGCAVVAHVGDSRVVLSRRGRAVALTEDHKPSAEAERKRIERCGGYVADGRVNGDLSVSRSLGDYVAGSGGKMVGLGWEPEVASHRLAPGDEFLLLACDGLWDVMSCQSAVSFVRRSLRRHGDSLRAAREVVAEAFRRSSTDNVTAIVVSFHDTPGHSWAHSASSFSSTAAAPSAGGPGRSSSRDPRPAGGPTWLSRRGRGFGRGRGRSLSQLLAAQESAASTTSCPTSPITPSPSAPVATFGAGATAGLSSAPPSPTAAAASRVAAPSPSTSQGAWVPRFRRRMLAQQQQQQ